MPAASATRSSDRLSPETAATRWAKFELDCAASADVTAGTVGTTDRDGGKKPPPLGFASKPRSDVMTSMSHFPTCGARDERKFVQTFASAQALCSRGGRCEPRGAGRRRRILRSLWRPSTPGRLKAAAHDRPGCARCGLSGGVCGARHVVYAAIRLIASTVSTHGQRVGMALMRSGAGRLLVVDLVYIRCLPFAASAGLPSILRSGPPPAGTPPNRSHPSAPPALRSASHGASYAMCKAAPPVASIWAVCSTSSAAVVSSESGRAASLLERSRREERSALNLPSRAPERTAIVHGELEADRHCLRRSQPVYAE